MPGPKGEGDLQGSKHAAFRAPYTMDGHGSDLIIPRLVAGTPADLARLKDNYPGGITRAYGFSANGLNTPSGNFKQPVLDLPPRFGQMAFLLTESRTINYDERARNRPREWRDYMTESPSGETRFNFDNPHHQATMAYIGSVDRETGEVRPGAYESFQVDTSKNLALLMEDYGVDTIDEVRERIMRGSGRLVPMINSRIVVPYNHHQPNKGEGHYAEDFFNWDNRWSVQWAVGRGDFTFAKGVMDNIESVYKPVGWGPNSTALKIIDRDQPFMEPLMLSDIAKILPQTPEDQAWYDHKVDMLKNMYFKVWFNDPTGEELYDTYRYKREGHTSLWKNQALTPTGLPRYSGADVPDNHYSAEAACGEDLTPRFKGRAADYNATDLAGLMGIAQKFFYKEAKRKGNMEEAAHWQKQWETTRALVNKYMWNEEKGFYMDYNFKTEEQSDVMALAAYTIGLAGFDTDGSIEESESGVPSDRLRRMVGNLKKFQVPYGLATTVGDEGPTPGRGPDDEQWKYPHVWAPRNDAVFSLLKHNPEFHGELEEVLIRYMIGHSEYHARHHTMAEAINGQTGKLTKAAQYSRDETHEGFLWTAAVYARAERLLRGLYSGRDQEQSRGAVIVQDGELAGPPESVMIASKADLVTFAHPN